MKSLDIVRPKTALKEEPKAKPKKAVPKVSDLSVALKDAIDGHISEGINGRWKQSVGFSPSNTNECIRFMCYTFRGVYLPATHDSRVQRVFDVGNDVHTRITKYFADMGILIAEEYEIMMPAHLPIPVKAYADAIIDWNGRKVVEIKSINEAGFMARKMYKKPKDDHFKQIQMYLAALDMKSGFVIYENKNDQNLLVLEVERDDEYLAKLFKRYKKVWEIHESGVLPPRPYKQNSKSCNWCALKEKCWSDPE